MNEFLSSTKFIAILAGLGSGVLTFFIGLLMERYKNRSLQLIQYINYQKIGIPDDYFLSGDLKVTYNEHRINSLYLYRLLIKNNSNFDSKELPITFFTDIDSYILSDSYTSLPATTDLSPSIDYSKRLNDYVKNMEPFVQENILAPENLIAEGRFINSTRILVASSLNRKEEIEISILIGSQIHNHLPYLYTRIPTSGVTLLEGKDPIKENDRIGKISILTGVLLTIILGLYFLLNNQDYKAAVIIISIIGALNPLIGILIYRTCNFIYSYFK